MGTSPPGVTSLRWVWGGGGGTWKSPAWQHSFPWTLQIAKLEMEECRATELWAARGSGMLDHLYSRKRPEAKGDEGEAIARHLEPKEGWERLTIPGSRILLCCKEGCWWSVRFTVCRALCSLLCVSISSEPHRSMSDHLFCPWQFNPDWWVSRTGPVWIHLYSIDHLFYHLPKSQQNCFLSFVFRWNSFFLSKSIFPVDGFSKSMTEI